MDSNNSDVSRRSSVCVTKLDLANSSKKSSSSAVKEGKTTRLINNIFSRSSVQHGSGAKIAKKRIQTDLEGADKRERFFLQGRSSTNLNLFGGGARRRSIACADASMRGTKSYVDLTDEASIPGPGLTDLKENQALMTSAKPSTFKLSFKDKSWTDLERLWKGKVRESPNIESMFKPRSSFRSNQDRSTRSKTIPLEGMEQPHKLMNSTSTSNSSSTSASTSASTSTSTLVSSPNKLSVPGRLSPSPGVARKAIDLLAPHVFSEWQEDRGYPPIYQRYTSMPAAVTSVAAASAAALVQSCSQDSDHFDLLVKAW